MHIPKRALWRVLHKDLSLKAYKNWQTHSWITKITRTKETVYIYIIIKLLVHNPTIDYESEMMAMKPKWWLWSRNDGSEAEMMALKPELWHWNRNCTERTVDSLPSDTIIMNKRMKIQLNIYCINPVGSRYTGAETRLIRDDTSAETWLTLRDLKI